MAERSITISYDVYEQLVTELLRALVSAETLERVSKHRAAPDNAEAIRQSLRMLKLDAHDFRSCDLCQSGDHTFLPDVGNVLRHLPRTRKLESKRKVR